MIMSLPSGRLSRLKDLQRGPFFEFHILLIYWGGTDGT